MESHKSGKFYYLFFDSSCTLQNTNSRIRPQIDRYVLKIKIKERCYFFKKARPIIVPTKVKDPIIAATNTVSATDANCSPTTPINIADIRIINPIKANSPKIMDLISSTF